MKIISKKSLGIKNVVEITVDGEIYVDKSGVISHNCKHCLAMYHTKSNPRVPRVWKISQLNQGYFKPKEWTGNEVFKMAHPRCRHSMSILMPGFGFDDGGKVQYIGPGHDEYKKQKQSGDT